MDVNVQQASIEHDHQTGEYSDEVSQCTVELVVHYTLACTTPPYHTSITSRLLNKAQSSSQALSTISIFVGESVKKTAKIIVWKTEFRIKRGHREEGEKILGFILKFLVLRQLNTLHTQYSILYHLIYGY